MRMLDSLRPNRLQTKVMAVILIIVVFPMVSAGVWSAAWVTNNFERSIESWIREAAQVNEDSLHALQSNGLLFADLLVQSAAFQAGVEQRRRIEVPARLVPLLKQLGITLLQLYDDQRQLVYSSMPVKMQTLWQPGQTEAILKVRRGTESLLAAVAITALPQRSVARHYLVLGSLLDSDFLTRLASMSGLRTRLFYPEGNDYARAFGDDTRHPPLKVRLPPGAYAELQHQKPFYNERAEEGRYRGLYTPIADNTGHVEAVLFSGLEGDGVDTLLIDRVALTIAIAVLGLLVGAMAGLFLSVSVVQPVADLRDGVLRLAAQDFRAEVPVNSRDELGDLARAFNAMAATLRDARDQQRRDFQKDKLIALGELSLALAHEIRNPLGVINTATSMLPTVQNNPERQAELVRMMREESVRLNRLLKDFQQLARHRRPEFSDIDPVEPLQRAVRVALAGREDVEVQRRLEHGDARISADAELLQQAWMNLLVNALQAIGAGEARLTLHSRCDNGEVIVSLEDSGPGIALEIMPRLFEPFYTTKSGGTGLGLTIANTLVEANGGQLEVLPPEHGGAHFGMRFPTGARTWS